MHAEVDFALKAVLRRARIPIGWRPGILWG